MKKLFYKCSAVAIGLLLTGCAGVFDAGEEQLTEDIKSVFTQEVKAFFENNDWADSLGINKEDQTELEESIRNYVDNYELDEEALSEAKNAVNEVLENAKGLSTEEIKDKISAIFENQE